MFLVMFKNTQGDAALSLLSVAHPRITRDIRFGARLAPHPNSAPLRYAKLLISANAVKHSAPLHVDNVRGYAVGSVSGIIIRRLSIGAKRFYNSRYAATPKFLPPLCFGRTLHIRAR